MLFSSAQAGAPPGRLRSGIVLVTLLTCQLMIVLDITVMNVALPRIQHDLHFSATGLSWVMNAYTLVFGGLLLLGGRAGDLFGRRRLFILGTVLFTLASLGGGLAPSAAWLIVARIVQGLGGAMAGPNTLALLTTTFADPKMRVRVLALFSGMSSAGFAIGLILGGLLTQWLSWRSVLFINVPFGLVVALLAVRYLPDAPRRRAHLDLPGAVTATGAVAALVYGFISAAAHGWDDVTTDVSLTVGVVALVAFLLIERRAVQPLLPLHLFADRNRAAAYANMFLGPMAGTSMFFFLTQYLQEVRGMSALATGFAFLPTAVTMFTMIRLIPRLLPRFGPKPVTLVGTAAMIAGLVLLTLLDTDTGYFPLLAVATVLMGCGIGLAFSPLNVIIMANVAPEEAGAAGGALQTLQQTGAALGLAVLVTVFGTAVRAASGSAVHVLVSGITTAFAAAAGIAVLTLLVASTFRSVRTQR
ncbi:MULTISPECIES: MFS transporter [Nocardia]|uniref:MFS transporter n=1 Tax=Nocardia TaxID=1817 RepID=UPI0007E98DD3|nr:MULTISPECIES: MFS transporter [Nocardia]OBA47603.1 MFS transporter [Nocardia sp. 852002-51101_SCH5132738]OBB39210.1 MFS transporter [Nocardia sp. 852002-51244_SCH5132740]OBF78044.1 MFS transporter [Mycobacterium sp. 852002-51759_SCH5129042]